jgi:hypothetical protein
LTIAVFSALSIILRALLILAAYLLLLL